MVVAVVVGVVVVVVVVFVVVVVALAARHTCIAFRHSPRMSAARSACLYI